MVQRRMDKEEAMRLMGQYACIHSVMVMGYTKKIRQDRRGGDVLLFINLFVCLYITKSYKKKK